MSRFDPKEDFANVMDGLESVRLRRRDSSRLVSVDAAFRLQSETSEAEPSDGHAQQTDMVWHLVLVDAELEPQLGDQVIDPQANHWTILETQRLPLLQRWKCVTRELRIANGCDARVDVQRAVWADNGSGPEIIDWRYVTTALPVRIQVDEQKLANESITPPSQKSQYTIVLSELAGIAPNDRLVGSDGAQYRVESLHQADRMDVLPVAKVRLEETA